MWRKIKLNLATGILVLLPLYLTYIILAKLFLLIDGIFNRIATRALVAALKLPLSEDQVIYGIGTIALIILVFFTGSIARNYFGKKTISWFNYQLDHIPVISAIYKTLRQISEAIFSGKKEAFQKPVLIEYPRKGLYTFAFMTHGSGGRIEKYLNEECISVFLPSTPNPTTGFLIFVPKSQVIDVDFTTEEAMKLIISGGVITSDELPTSPDNVPISQPATDSDISDEGA